MANSYNDSDSSDDTTRGNSISEYNKIKGSTTNKINVNVDDSIGGSNRGVMRPYCGGL